VVEFAAVDTTNARAAGVMFHSAAQEVFDFNAGDVESTALAALDAAVYPTDNRATATAAGLKCVMIALCRSVIVRVGHVARQLCSRA
jgi:hypothetical protein